MKKLITTVLATMVVFCTYSQDGIHLPLTGGTLTGSLKLHTGGYPYIDFGANSSNYWRFLYDNPEDKFLIQKDGATRISIGADGRLSGTYASFTGNLGIGSANDSRIYMQNTTPGTGRNWNLISDTDGAYRIGVYGIGNFLTISSNGNTELSGALTGASATFSGDATSNSINLTSVGGGVINNQTANMFLQKPPGAGFIFRDGSPGYVEHMRLDQNGYLGIGISSPQSLLHVQSPTVGSNIVRFASGGFGGGTRGVNIYSDDSYVKFQVSDNTGNIGSWANLTLNPDGGRVGIGTTTPNNTLHVLGTNLFASAGEAIETIKITGNDQSNTRIKFQNGDAAWGLVQGITNTANTGFTIYDYTTQATRLTIAEGSGYVGIGTTNPDSKLTVAGKIHSQEVKVTIDAGADFVFEKDYKLKPLSEVAAFISTNKHLPEIASAKEMEKNGLDLGEMNIKLLQKIEELTLHLIEQNKLILQQNKLNLEQNKRIEELENKIKK